MKTSTCRDSNVKHSTGNNETRTKNTHGRRPRPRTSTGEKAAITHFTGKSFDPKRQEEVEEKKAAKRKPPQAA